MFAICWYFCSSLSSICNLFIILASECSSGDEVLPLWIFFFLLRFPNEMLSVKKGLFQNRCESCWPINHQVHCVWPGIFRNFASCPIPLLPSDWHLTASSAKGSCADFGHLNYLHKTCWVCFALHSLLMSSDTMGVSIMFLLENG